MKVSSADNQQHHDGSLCGLQIATFLFMGERMATTRIIPMHINKGKTIAQCMKVRISCIISMFWNVTTCQKRKIFAGKSVENNNMAPLSDTAFSGKLAQGPFFFAFQARPTGQMKRENDTTTELQPWFSGAWGRSQPASFCKT